MKLLIRKAQMKSGEKTFIDDSNVEIHWSEGNDGCMLVVKANIGWKEILKYTRQTKKAFQKHLANRK